MYKEILVLVGEKVGAGKSIVQFKKMKMDDNEGDEMAWLEIRKEGK
jgi:hypothetical protein